MKKSVILLIGIIYVIAIAVVSFFGLKIETFNETIYATSVEIINEGVKIDSEGKYVVIEYVENPTETDNTYQLEWRVHPDNATRDIVEFVISESDKNKEIATISNFGAVRFLKPLPLKVFVISTDGSNKMDSITIIPKKAK